jgi:hypothetical protein
MKYLFLATCLILNACHTKHSPVQDYLKVAEAQADYAIQCLDSSVNNSKENNYSLFPKTLNNDGTLKLIDQRDWCAGFFPGTLWLLYEETNNTKWKTYAEIFTEQLTEQQFDTASHDIGFKIICSFGNGYRLTNNQHYKNVIVQAAKTLTKRYNHNIGLIRSWDFNRNIWQFPVIIDNMMNLELLFEATNITGDSTYFNIALSHAKLTQVNHFRYDYSSFHVVDYDTLTTQPRIKVTHQGLADSSAWARGQAWGLYGFTMAYRYTQNNDFLTLAQNIANFILNHHNLPDDQVPYWDFDDPNIPDAPKDASAAAITAAALYELAKYSNEKHDHYISHADKIVNSLIQNYTAKPLTNKGFLLLHGTGNKPANQEVNVPLNYADYYLMEAIVRKTKRD